MNLRRSFRCATGIVALPMIFVSMPVLAGNKKPPLQPVNLNTATALELQQVPGIGPSPTDKILKMGKSYGQFTSVADPRAINRMGPKRTEKMRKSVAVGKPVAPKEATNTGATSSGSPSAAKSPRHAPAKSLQQNPSDVALKQEHLQEKEPT